MWDDLAEMYNFMETDKEVQWPKTLATAAIALIPKGEGPAPEKQRPITLFSILYRLYSSIRYEDTEEWQESWAPPEVYGGRKGMDALDATWEVALEVEEAFLQLRSLVAAMLDNSKFFDFFIRHIMWPLLLRMGAPPGLVRMMIAFYEQAIRFIRIGTHCGGLFHPENGLGQGDPLTMRWTNCTGAIWIRCTRNVRADTRLSVYVDDRTVRAGTVEDLEVVIAVTITFDGHLGQILNVPKSSVMATTANQRKTAANLQIGGQTMRHVWDARNLGAHIKTVKKTEKGLGRKRLEGAVESAIRIGKNTSKRR